MKLSQKKIAVLTIVSIPLLLVAFQFVRFWFFESSRLFKVFVSNPIPSGVYDIQGECRGSFIDWWIEIRFKYSSDESLSFLEKQWIRAQPAADSPCEGCTTWHRKDDLRKNGILTINPGKKEGVYGQPTCREPNAE